MAEEIIIKIGTEADLTGAESIDDLIEEIRSNAEVEISVDVDDTSIQDATSTTGELEGELETVDSTVVTPTVDTSSLEEASSAAQETVSSMDNIATAAAGIAATAGVEQMITTADNINNSWNRLELTFKGTGVSMDTLKNKASALSETTGRSGGVVRDYFNQMGIAGVTNTELLASSFEALSGKAYQTNQSVEAMEGKLQRMVMTGNASGMMLQRLGIEAEDLANAMGVSADQVSEAFKNLTPEERLAAISKAMGEGAEANEMYKNSYQGLKDRANAAMAGLAGAVGQAILPIVIPALEAATKLVKMLTDGFKMLPGPVQGAIGAVLGIVTIGTTVIGTLGMVGKVIGTVKTGLEAIGMLGKVTSVISSISGAFSSLWGVIIANPIILLVVAIVALIAALVWAYYNVDWFREMVNNAWKSIQDFAGWIQGTFMAAINGIGEAFQNAGEMLTNAFTGSVEYVKSILQGLYDYIMTLGGLIPEGVNITGNQIVDSILAVMAFIATLPLQLSIIFVNMIASLLGFGDNFVQNMFNTGVTSVAGFLSQMATLPGRLASTLGNALNNVISWGSNIVSRFLSAASQSVSNFGSQIARIPQVLAAELGNALNKVSEWAATLPAKFWEAGVNAVRNFLSALGIGSPGTMQRTLVWEVSEMARRTPIEGKHLKDNIKTLGSDVVDAFGHPTLGVDFDDTANASIISNAEAIRNGSLGQVNNFYFSDIVVDDDSRMEKIYDYFVRRMSWDNNTAGRSV